VRVRAVYRIKGRDIRVTWVQSKNKRYVWADADWTLREIRFDSRLRAKKYADKLKEMLVHELLHLLWWYDHKGETHPVWEIRHSDFPRYFCTIDRLLREGTDGS
jgi:hypothetical protein